jgi:hypothetical protein
MMGQQESARDRWLKTLVDRGTSEETARQLSDLIAGSPEIAYAEPESAEEVESLLATVDTIVQTVDLEKLGVTHPTQARLALVFALWLTIVQDSELFDSLENGEERLEPSLPYIRT